MKELRFDASDGVWRFAFAFDRKREGVVLCGATSPGAAKSGSIDT